ncbi:hypothetical protein PHLGIDRAFT_117984 [Phlebiopsis gigantea 11061_1 CR5-6]|uniref:Heterokaryon incompatibility domain-containing protein n=1 Tax=Phlebiopsis gigantea (strain 11061_1 CR5-6) TaxID=745531 RepID=A0A0C3PLZ0_PHLG1|nr:hypothetical protein PHLGIDRAFT_117984 [Phlebiopsis gigantea 11061_1 CR5-6]
MSLKSFKLKGRLGARDSNDKGATAETPSVPSGNAPPASTSSSIPASPDLSASPSPSGAQTRPQTRSLLERTASFAKGKTGSSSPSSSSGLRDEPIDENETPNQLPLGSPDPSASDSSKQRPSPKPLGKLSGIASSISLPSPISLSRSNSLLLPLSKLGASEDGRSPLASIDPLGLIETVFGNAKSGPFGNVKDIKSYVYNIDGVPGMRRLGRASTRVNEVKKDVVAQAVERRKQLFKMMVVLSNGLAMPDIILKSGRTNQGVQFVLRPAERSSIPLQWVHRGPGAIDDALAVTPCSDLGVGGLLAKLNEVLGTTYALEDEHNLRVCLEYFTDSKVHFDFGRAYGMLRPAWSGNNRVLPFWAIADPDPDSSDLQPESETPAERRSNIPDNLYTVSHAWVDKSDFHFIPTPINDYEWPVPIPRDTSLEHVRVELLNLGAEYAWIDIFCLRQKIPRKQSKYSTVKLRPLTKKQRKDFEELRLEEWKLDVPTIGHIYQHDRYQTVITYFNGLGRPFVIGPSIVRSSLHWINRAWTLQETTPTWLPGGMTIALFDMSKRGQQIRPGLFEQLQRLCAVVALNPPDIFSVIRAVQDRAASNPVDRVGAVAYLLKLSTLPTYDPKADVEEVWPRLLFCLSDKHRTDLLTLYPLRGDNNDCRWAPSWYQLMQLEPPKAPRIPYAAWEYVRPAEDAGGRRFYYHEAHVLRNCKVYLSGKCVGVLEVHEEDNTDKDASVRLIEKAPAQEVDTKPVSVGEGLPAHTEDEPPEPPEEPIDPYEDENFDGYVSDRSEDGEETATLVGGEDEDEAYDSDASTPSKPPSKKHRYKITTNHTQPIAMGEYALVGVADMKYWIIGKCVEEDLEGTQKVFKIDKTSVIRLHNPDRRQLQKSGLGFARAKVVYL